MTGIDYRETFACVPKMATIRLLFALTTHFNLNMDLMDIITAFLHLEINEEIYMELPKGYGMLNNNTLSL